MDSVSIRGAGDLDAEDVGEKLATAPTEKFLGLFRGVLYDYEVYDPSVLQRDLARVERIYRGKGFFEAHARAGRVEHVSASHVQVEITVEPGPPTLNHDLRVDGLEGLPLIEATLVRATAQSSLPAGVRFDEETYANAKIAVRRALTDRGYAYATVTSDSAVDVGKRTADYVFTVVPGAKATFGKITIVGLDPDKLGPRPQEIDEAPLRRAMSIDEGSEYSTAAIDAATQALLDLEVFSAVEIEPQLPEPPPASHVVPLLVKVQPTRLRLLRLGGGLEFDEIKTDVHLLAGWEDHNFLGGLRDLSIEFKPGAVLYPTRLNNIVAPNQLLPEERLKVQLRQPSFLEAHTVGFVRPEFNIFPLLVETNPNPDQPVVGYHEIKGAAGVDRPFWKFFASVAYNVQVEAPFTYVGALDPDLNTLVIAYPELFTKLDLRDDPIHPRDGFYLANNLQIAGGPFGGQAQDLRVQPEFRVYLPISRKVTLAARGSVGFLFASNYGGVVHDHLQDTDNTSISQAERVRDIETVYFRGFYSGGPNSNRGYPLRGIAPHGVVPFLNPATARQQVALNCNPNKVIPDPNDPTHTKFIKAPIDPVSCSIPIGGFTLWELSTELRVNIAGPFSSALFCDAGDVSPKEASLRFEYLHLSCGLGVRYDTPVGPIRLDVGYRIQPLQVLGYANEIEAGKPVTGDAVNGTPARLFGVPIAIAFGIGEAF